MTNTMTQRIIEAIADEHGFKPDPGFSGELAKYSKSGSIVAVVAFDGRDGMDLELYVMPEGDDEYVRVKREEYSIKVGWGELPEHIARRRLTDFDDILLLDQPRALV